MDAPDAPSGARLKALAASAVLLGIVTYADYVTGYEVGLFVFYFIPISIAAWYCGRRAGLAFAVLAAACWYLSDRLASHPYSRPWLIYWETGIYLAAFVTLALTTAEIGSALVRERRSKEQLSALLAEVRELEGLISVCAWCRKVRDDSGYWDRFERFLAKRTKATVTHAICPECLAKVERDSPD